MTLLNDGQPLSFAEALADLVDDYLEDTPIDELIEAIAAELDGLKTEETDHARAASAGSEADNPG